MHFVSKITLFIAFAVACFASRIALAQSDGNFRCDSNTHVHISTGCSNFDDIFFVFVNAEKSKIDVGSAKYLSSKYPGKPHGSLNYGLRACPCNTPPGPGAFLLYGTQGSATRYYIKKWMSGNFFKVNLFPKDSLKFNTKATRRLVIDGTNTYFKLNNACGKSWRLVKKSGSAYKTKAVKMAFTNQGLLPSYNNELCPVTPIVVG